MQQPGRGRPVAEFRSELHGWLDAHHEELAPPYARPERSTSRSRRCNA